MVKPLEQLRSLAKEHGVPIVCAGDVFDRWNPPPELINFAIDNLPPMYAIPGQHDLPYHRYDDLKKSAYWTLVEAGILRDERPYEWINNTQMFEAHPEGGCKSGYHTPDILRLFAFPWGFDLTSCQWDKNAGRLRTVRLAVVHRYVWTKGYSYPHAPKEQRLGVLKNQLAGYDAVVFGDNHKGFLVCNGIQYVLNCGSLMRRKADEIDYEPSIGVLYDDASIERVFLDVSDDKWTEAALERRYTTPSDVSDFVEALDSLEAEELDYRTALERRASAQSSREVSDLLLESVDAHRNSGLVSR